MFPNCIYPFTYLAIVFCLLWIYRSSWIARYTNAHNFTGRKKKELGGKRITPAMCVRQLICLAPFGHCNSEIGGARQTLIMQPPIWSLNTPLPPHQHFSVRGPKRDFTPFQHRENCIHTCSDYWSQPAHAFISRALFLRHAGNVNVSIWRLPNPLSSYKRDVLKCRSTEEPRRTENPSGRGSRQTRSSKWGWL